MYRAWLAASDRVFAFLNEEEMENEREKNACLPEVKGDVSFRHVAFGYTPDNLLMKDVSFEAKAGQEEDRHRRTYRGRKNHGSQSAHALL